MNAVRQDDEAPATVAQTTPAGIGYGHPEYHFVQAIMEMRGTLGEINLSIKALEKSVESTKSKVDDLVQWKHKILGGAFVAGALISVFVFLLTKASDYVTFKAPEVQLQQAAPSSQIAQPTPQYKK